MINKNKLKTHILTLALLFTFSTAVFSATIDEAVNVFKAGDYNKAIQMFEDIAKNDPLNPEPYKWLAKCYESTFDIDKSIKASEKYQKLLYQQEKKVIVSATPEATPTPDDSNKEPDSSMLARLDNSFLEDVVNQRPDDASKNKTLKPLDFETLEMLFSSVSTEGDELNDIYKKHQIKVYYGIATHNEKIVYKKAEAEVLRMDIDVKTFQRNQEQDTKKRKLENIEITNLVKDYNNIVKELTGLINLAVYPNTDPLSFENYTFLGESPKKQKEYLEDMRTRLEFSLKKVIGQVNNLKTLTLQQEKDLVNMKKKIPGNLLQTDASTLTGYEKDLVTSYYNLDNKIFKDKKSLFYYLMEQDILNESIAKINQTMRKI